MRDDSTAADDLSGFRWHTGAPLRRISPDESCPVLFRDLGPKATAMFLRGQLRRFAGPWSPITYMRSVEYREPYTDYERIGRIVILQPQLLGVWHSGVAHVFVARAKPGVDSATIGFVPGDIDLNDAARLATGLATTCQWREALGGRSHDDAIAESLHQLDCVEVELNESEVFVEPWRSAMQSCHSSIRERARATMSRIGLTENDLCNAWHHLPRERRGAIVEALRRLPHPGGGSS